jgi:hypothetical protein
MLQLRIVRIFETSQPRQNKHGGIIAGHRQPDVRSVRWLRSGTRRDFVAKNDAAAIVTKATYFVLAGGVLLFVSLFMLTLIHP